jgi:hypothetical protein
MARWFEEGMAMYVGLRPEEREAQRRRVQEDARRNILGSLSSSPYDIGVVGVMYLLDRYGSGACASILVRMQAGERFPAVFQSVTGLTPEAFEQAFRAAMR